MTFNEYIEAIASVENTTIKKAIIVVDIFKAAGRVRQFEEDTANSWLSGERNCQIRRYFPEGKINNVEGLFKYFRNRTGAFLKSLQEAFRPINTDKIVQCNIDDMDKFCRSLVNQFTAIFNLTWPEWSEESNSGMPKPNNEMPSKQMREIFIDNIKKYTIMEIINKKPVIFDRNDSTAVDIFINKIRDLILSNKQSNTNATIYPSIKNFTTELHIKFLSIEATMNRRFDFDNESASINMENDDDSIQVDRRSYNPAIPELSLELIKEAADPLGMLDIAVKEWGDFRNKMNFLYNEIHNYHNKAEDV